MTSEPNFLHEALLYAGDRGFLAGAVPFIRDGLRGGEPILAVVSASKGALLREALGDEGAAVTFADTTEVGRNPAHLIPAWHQFVTERAAPDRRVRGISEPVWPGRRPAELAECRRHEALVNLAFADAPGWSLLCAYDVSALGPRVVDEARRTHPILRHDGTRRPSLDYDPGAIARAYLDDPLPEPAGRPAEVAFAPGHLGGLRRLVFEQAVAEGLDLKRAADLASALNEVAANSVRHGGGAGILRMWRENGGLVCEIRDRGLIDWPLVDRQRPMPGQIDGWGLWLANQLCDLVQLRSYPTGSAVRIHMWQD